MRKAKLTRLDEGGYNSDGSQQEVIIDRTTHLGRFDGQCQAESPNCTSTMIGDAETGIAIEDRSGFISRNHAIIYPPEGSVTRFWLRDLRSTNGTYVNNCRLSTGSGTDLLDGDLLNLGTRGATFRFSEIREALLSNHALLVGHDGHNLKGVANDVRGFRAALEPRGFRNRVRSLVNHEASKERVLEGLHRMRCQATDDSASVFYFSGHGSKFGDLQLGRESLAATELMRSLSGFRGKILMILDGCYTDSVAQAGLPDNSVMIGHKTAAYEGPMTQLGGVDYGNERPVRGYTTRAIIRALMDQPHRVSTNQIASKLKRDPRIFLRQRIGYHPMTNIILGTRLPS